jgi:hypothetical protein
VIVSRQEQRRALRVAVNIPTLVETIGQAPVKLHPSLAEVYERVSPTAERVGEKFPAVVRDLSTNGAFITGEALPLLSRVAFTFPLDGYGQVEALAWTLWRRSAECELPRPDGSTAVLPAGFGVLFESIPLDARIAIHKLVHAAT